MRPDGAEGAHHRKHEAALSKPLHNHYHTVPGVASTNVHDSAHLFFSGVFVTSRLRH